MAKSVYDEDPGQNYHWHGWIDACDVNNDGLIDLSAQVLGLTELRLHPNVGQIEWINTGTDQWTQRIDACDVNNDGLIDLSPQKMTMPTPFGDANTMSRNPSASRSQTSAV